MQTQPRTPTKLEAAAERRAARAERRATTAEAEVARSRGFERRATAAESAATQAREEATRLARDLVEMREDRDRWRAQAERLAIALDRLRQPAPELQPAQGATAIAESNLLDAYEDIGRHLRHSPRQVKHLAENGAIPTLKLPVSNIVRARRFDVNSWLATRAATAQEGR